MIKKEITETELYVWIFCPIKRKWDLLYKRWLKNGFGMVMDRMPFTAREIDNQKEK